MRLMHDKSDLNYNDTRTFFENRSHSYNKEKPYSVTMYQDNNYELVERRNEVETKKLLGRMRLDADSRILDLACGIGRWVDAIGTGIHGYCGIDFSEGLINIARERNAANPKTEFYVGSTTEISTVLDRSYTFNRILIIGHLIYLNDADVYSVLNQVVEYCESNTIICIREPIGISDRLTLKEYYSEELRDYYNAIYRTTDELKEVLECTLLKEGFEISEEGFLFDDENLNNRKDTAQYYYILER